MRTISGWITNAGSNYLLDLLTARRAAYPRYFVALIGNAPPSRFISGAELDEPVFSDYARASYENSSDYWTTSSGEVHNTVQATFPVAAADWGTQKFWAICSAAAAGEVLWAGPITIPLVVATGDQVVLNPGTLTLRLVSYAARVSL